ncbi:uncharacterized protein LOC126884113 [Diabrotica virgifera virgifera]|uniref:CCHC-type domain-containing protein n=1 Tax=Diabrotica virgifera virgifera TaxID=50390 RepID=A0ABM5K6R1_DIAVI|nr:uncharacterized protein LOC126884113 [Diabrotica virgifera virgifera]
MKSTQVNDLKTDELSYELFIRGFNVQNKTVEEKRKLLRGQLSKETISSSIDLTKNVVDPDQELPTIQSILADLQSIARAMSAQSSKADFARFKTRSSHLDFRLENFPDNVEEAIKEVIDNYKMDLLMLTGDVLEKEETSDNVSVPSTSGTTSVPVAPISSVSAPIIQISTPVRVSDLNIKFNGESKALPTFLEKVRDSARSRNISDDVLFRSAFELFDGNAAIWYRSVGNTVNSWNELVTLLKTAFLPPDYNDNLLDEIKGRKQKKSESITIYSAIMENLFKRLEEYPSEAQRVKILRKNILVDYIPLVALQDFPTVEMLVITVKRLEQNVLPLLQTTKGLAGISLEDSEKPQEKLQVLDKQDKPDNPKGDKREKQDRPFKKSKSTQRNERPNPPVDTDERHQSSSSYPPERHQSSSSYPPHRNQSSYPPPLMQSPPYRPYGNQSSSYQPHSMQPPPQPYQTHDNPRKIIFCFTCGKPNHISRNCTNREMSCSRCGNKGVRTSSCMCQKN